MKVELRLHDAAKAYPRITFIESDLLCDIYKVEKGAYLGMWTARVTELGTVVIRWHQFEPTTPRPDLCKRDEIKARAAEQKTFTKREFLNPPNIFVKCDVNENAIFSENREREMLNKQKAENFSDSSRRNKTAMV